MGIFGKNYLLELWRKITWCFRLSFK